MSIYSARTSNDRLQQIPGCGSQCTGKHVDLDTQVHSSKYVRMLRKTLIQSGYQDVRATISKVEKYCESCCLCIIDHPHRVRGTGYRLSFCTESLGPLVEGSCAKGKALEGFLYKIPMAQY